MLNKIKNIIFCCIFIIGAITTIYIEGPCPDVKPVENFNLTLFGGRWYQIARYEDEYQSGTCVVLDILNENNTHKFEINEYSADKRLKVIGHFDYSSNSNKNGLLTMHSSVFDETEGTSILPFNVLDMEYDSYIVVYECKYNELKKKNHVYVYVASRSTTLTADARVKVENFIKSSGAIDSHRFIWNHFDAQSCGMKIE